MDGCGIPQPSDCRLIYSIINDGDTIYNVDIIAFLIESYFLTTASRNMKFMNQTPLFPIPTFSPFPILF